MFDTMNTRDIGAIARQVERQACKVADARGRVERHAGYAVEESLTQWGITGSGLPDAIAEFNAALHALRSLKEMVLHVAWATREGQDATDVGHEFEAWWQERMEAAGLQFKA